MVYACTTPNKIIGKYWNISLKDIVHLYRKVSSGSPQIGSIGTSYQPNVHGDIIRNVETSPHHRYLTHIAHISGQSPCTTTSSTVGRTSPTPTRTASPEDPVYLTVLDSDSYEYDYANTNGYDYILHPDENLHAVDSPVFHLTNKVSSTDNSTSL